MIAPQHRKKIEALIDLADRSWVDEQVDRHDRFRATKSPRNLWSHRRPTTSPLIPLIYEYRNPRSLNQDFTLGYWYGEPTLLLAQIAEQVFLFQDYWDNLPNERGRRNLRNFLLRRPHRFSSFLHELMVATHYALEPDSEVEPAFFDPKSGKGQPDILLRRNGKEIGIQCKSRSPIEALDLSFDLFQYLAGLLIRAVEDSERSFRFTLMVKQKLTASDINEIAVKAQNLLASDFYLPFPIRYPKYDLHVRELKNSPAGLSNETLKRVVYKTQGDNFVVGAGLNCTRPTGNCKNLAVVSVSGPKPLDFVPWTIKTAWDAAGSSPSNIPMILALHLLGSVDFQRIIGQDIERAILAALKDMLLKYRHIQTVTISSDHQVYSGSQSEGASPSTERIEYTSPFFASPS